MFSNRKMKLVFDIIIAILMIIDTLVILVINFGVIIVNDRTNILALCFFIFLANWFAYALVRFVVSKWNDIKIKNLIESMSDTESEELQCKYRKFVKRIKRKGKK